MIIGDYDCFFFAFRFLMVIYVRMSMWGALYFAYSVFSLPEMGFLSC